MKELITPPEELGKEVRQYGQELADFAESSGFPTGLLTEPDHVAFKVTGPSDFNNRVHSLKPWSEQIAFAELDWRFFVAAQLLVPVTLSEHRHVDWIDILEPKPERSNSDFAGLEYAEFYFSNFSFAERKLRAKRIVFERRADDAHSWLNIVINTSGQEVRLTDTKLVETVNGQLESGTARLLQS